MTVSETSPTLPAGVQICRNPGVSEVVLEPSSRYLFGFELLRGIAAWREQTPQGYRCLVRVKSELAPVGLESSDHDDLDGDDAPGSLRPHDVACHDSGLRVDPRDVLIETLSGELDHRTREISELHAVVGTQSQAIETTATLAALPKRTAAIERAQPGMATLGPMTFWAKVRWALFG